MVAKTKGKRKQREPFGRIRKLPSERYQAAYIGPDVRLHKASATFDTLVDARGWVAGERRRIDAGTWTAPERRQASRPATLDAYADAWLADRTLRPRTRELYRRLLDQKILPSLGGLPVAAIDPATVRQWYSGLDSAAPTRRAHAYALLRTILGGATTDGLITANPCHVRGAGSSKRVHKIKPASFAELEAIVEAIPDRYRLMVLLGAWCALRFGELAELRRRDVDLKVGKIMIRRAVTVVGGRPVVGLPKSDAGIRDVAIPPHLLPVVREHLASFAGWGKDGLLFPAVTTGGHLRESTFRKAWHKARDAAGRPDLRFHDLRHTGAVVAAQTGATLAELMSRLGHSTPAMAIRYQHAAQDRDAEIAKLLSAMVERRHV